MGDFVLHYDAVMDKLVSHRVFVSARYGSTGSYTTLAMLSWQTQSVPVAALPSSTTGPASESRGFVSAVHLGVDHISEGSDHLLFLVMLLLPAPPAATGRRWARRQDLGRAGWRVLHVVTAFAVGHSITLALGAMGWIHLPTRTGWRSPRSWASSTSAVGVCSRRYSGSTSASRSPSWSS